MPLTAHTEKYVFYHTREKMGLKFNLMRAEKTKLQISTQKKQNSNGSTSSTSCQYFTDKAALRFLFAFTIISGLVLLRGVTTLTKAVSGEKQIYSGNLEILPGIGKPGKFFGKYEIFSGH